MTLYHARQLSAEMNLGIIHHCLIQNYIGLCATKPLCACASMWVHIVTVAQKFLSLSLLIYLGKGNYECRKLL